MTNADLSALLQDIAFGDRRMLLVLGEQVGEAMQLLAVPTGMAKRPRPVEQKNSTMLSTRNVRRSVRISSCLLNLSVRHSPMVRR